MTQRTINFADDVCYYEDKSNDSHFAYVKPCEEGKECFAISSTLSDYAIRICQERSNEEYDKEGLTCETKESIIGFDCTDYGCNEESHCYDECQTYKVQEYANNRCIEDPGMCFEYKYDSIGDQINKYLSYEYKNAYSIYGKKKYVQLVLEETKSTSTIYQVKKTLTNYEAGIDNGIYIESNLSYLKYCKSGYALYYYGNGKDGSFILIEDEKLLDPEILFNLEYIGKENLSFPEMIINSINKVDIQIKHNSYENILLSGGNTCFNEYRKNQNQMTQFIEESNPEMQNNTILISSNNYLPQKISNNNKIKNNIIQIF